MATGKRENTLREKPAEKPVLEEIPVIEEEKKAEEKKPKKTQKEPKNKTPKNKKEKTPEIELGDDMKTLYLRLPDERLEKITTENFKVCVKYVELIESARLSKAS